MENLPNLESRETIIDRLIEDLAQREGMNASDILSDIITFVALSEDDPDANAYFEEVAEMIEISFEEMTEYAAKKAGQLIEEI